MLFNDATSQLFLRISFVNLQSFLGFKIFSTDIHIVLQKVNIFCEVSFANLYISVALRYISRFLLCTVISLYSQMNAVDGNDTLGFQPHKIITQALGYTQTVIPAMYIKHWIFSLCRLLTKNFTLFLHLLVSSSKKLFKHFHNLEAWLFHSCCIVCWLPNSLTLTDTPGIIPI